MLNGESVSPGVGWKAKIMGSSFFEENLLETTYSGISRAHLEHIERNIQLGNKPWSENFLAKRRLRDRFTEKQTGKLGPLLKEVGDAQIRAVTYIHQGNEAEIDLEHNPLEDICLLLCQNLDIDKEHLTTRNLGLCIKGPPRKKDLFEAVNPLVKQDQYTEVKLPNGEKKSYRTLARFEKWQTTMVRGLYLIARVSDENSELLVKTLDDYAAKYTQGQGTSEGIALGFLEVMNNANLLEDPMFEPLAHKLKTIVLEKNGDYEGLRQNYYYRVVDKQTFWENGREPLVIKITPPLPRETHPLVESKIHRFPSTKRWNIGVKRRESLQAQLPTLTTVNAITSTATQSEDTRINALVQQRTKRDLINAEVSDTERQLLSHVRTDFEAFIRYLANGTPLDVHDASFVGSAVDLVLTHFKDDPLLTQKMRTNINGKADGYHVDPDTLKKIPLVRWLILFKKDPTTEHALKQWAQTQPDSLYLLFKSMTHEVGKRFFASSESDFLFDATYQGKINSQDMIDLVDKIARLANRAKVDMHTLFIKAREDMSQETRALTVPRALKKRREELTQLLRHRLTRLARYRSVTRRDFLKGAASLGAMMLAGGALVEGLPAALNFFIPKIDRESDIGGRLPDGNSKNGEPKGDSGKFEKPSPKKFYDIVHLPDFLSKSEGKIIAFFPTSIPYSDVAKPITDPPDAYYDFSPFPNTEIVTSLDNVHPQYGNDELAILMKEPPLRVYAPDGWQIVKVVQQDGDTPAIDPNQTSLRYDYDQTYKRDTKKQPTQAIIVYRKLDKKEDYLDSYVYDLSTHVGVPRIVSYGNLHGPKYSPNIRDEFFHSDARILNSRLIGDPQLQTLHDDFLTEMNLWKGGGGNDLEVLTEIIKKYIYRYAQYTDSSRFYSLEMNATSESWYSGKEFDNLVQIADNPQKGYYCTVGSYAFSDFLESAGVDIRRKEGIALSNYSNQLWGDVGHAADVVYLPNGEILHVDMTPNGKTGLTPPEDIEKVKSQKPSFWDMHGQEIIDLSLKAGLTASGGVAMYLGIKSLAPVVDKAVIDHRIQTSLKVVKEMTPLESRVIAAATSQIAFMPDDERFSGEVAYQLELMRNFHQQTHGKLVEWLLGDQEIANQLTQLTPREAMYFLGSSYEFNLDNFREALPDSTYPIFASLTDRGRQSHDFILSDDDVPDDFHTAWEIARMIRSEESQASVRKLRVNLADRLEAKLATSEDTFLAALPEKTQTLLEMIRTRYRGDYPNENKPLLNAIYYSLTGKFLESLKIPEPFFS